MSGTTPFDESVPDRGPTLLSTTWSLTGLALLTTALRVASRAKHGLFGWDDGFMVLTMVGTTYDPRSVENVAYGVTQICFVGWTIVLTLYSARGGNQHVGDVQASGLENLAKVQLFNWMSQVFGIMGVAFGKVSISALLLGIIGTSELQWQRYYIWVVTVWLSVAISIACSILTFSQCQPAAALWDVRVDGTCINPKVMSSHGTFTGCTCRKAPHRATKNWTLTSRLAWNTFADASLAILPATIFWKLNCSRVKKVQLSIVFGFNILTSICSGIKTQYLVELGNRTDFTWATYDIFMWVTAELFLMVFCGTIPTLSPTYYWFVRMYERVLWSTSRRGASSHVTEPEHELNGGVQVQTTTTVEHRCRASFAESADNLVIKGHEGVHHVGIIGGTVEASGHRR